MVAKRATTGIPGGLQNSVEMIIEFIDSNVKDTFSHTNKYQKLYQKTLAL